MFPVPVSRNSTGRGTVLASWTSLFTVAHTVLERGGNLSIGLGDYHYRQGAEEPTNAQLVERAVRVAAEVGRKPATPAETRAILDLK
jgi:3-keto-5-aminohexanoate cleavage enzyme